MEDLLDAALGLGFSVLDFLLRKRMSIMESESKAKPTTVPMIIFNLILLFPVNKGKNQFKKIEYLDYVSPENEGSV